MTFGPKRGHIACIFDNFFKDFGLLIIAVVIALVTGDKALIEEYGFLFIVLVAGPVTRFVAFLTTIYTVDREKLTIQRGIFTKTELEVPLSTITTVDFSQNIFHQIFGVYRLNVDNNSSIATGESKVHMTLGKEEAELVRGLLIKGRKGLDGSNYAGEQIDMPQRKEEGVVSFDAKVSQLVLMGLLKSKTVFFLELLGGAAVVANFVPIPEDEAVDSIFDIVIKVGAGPAVLGTALVLLVIAAICGMVGSVIRYYGFKVEVNDEAVRITYGLLNRKAYTLSKKKIGGFYYEQSLLMRLCKTGVLNLMAVGYGAGSDEDTSEEALLFPLIRERDVKGLIAKVLPEMEKEEVYEKPKRKSLRYFFLRLSLSLSLIVLAGCLYLPQVDDFFDTAWMIGGLLVLLSCVAAVLDYKTTGVYGDEMHFAMTYGGMKKMTVYIKTAMIESIESGGSIWKRKRGIGDISIGCIAPMGMSTQDVNNLPVEICEKLKNYLIF